MRSFLDQLPRVPPKPRGARALRGGAPALVTLVLIASACDERGHTPRPAAAEAEPSPATPTAVESATERGSSAAEHRSQTAELRLGDIGMPTLEGAPSSDALRANRAALVHHREGRFEQSLEGFEDALVASPDYAMSRFNRACALSRLGRLEEAASELERLLREDLVTFAERLRLDPDLRALRASEHGARLQRRVDRLTALVGEALTRGVLSVTYVARDFDADPLGHTEYVRLRAGAYLHASLPEAGPRFVPLTPHAPDALAVLVDREARRAAVVSGEVRSGTMWIWQPRPVHAALYDLARAGSRIAHASAIERAAGLASTDYHELRVQLVPDALRMRFDGIDYDPDETITYELRESGLTRAGTAIDPQRPSTRIHGEGNHPLDPLPEGITLRRGRLLVSGRTAPIDLSRGHARSDVVQVLRSPAGDRVSVVSVRYRCEEGGAHASHVADLVALPAGTVTELARGDGVARAAFDAAGTLFLQSAEDMRRYPPGSTRAERDVLEGVRLTVPVADRDCSI